MRDLGARHPELQQAVDLHLEILECHRRVQGRVPLPWLDIPGDQLARHDATGEPLLQFEQIPIDPTDLRLLVRQTADTLRRFGLLEESAFQHIQTAGRDVTLLAMADEWFRRGRERHTEAGARAASQPLVAAPHVDPNAADQVFTLAMRPFLSRCAEVLQRHPDLGQWTHPYCPLCGGEPDFSAITPSAERHLICGRCTLRWKFEPLTCPFCLNADRRRITSFATPDGQYRIYCCDACRRFLKSYDGRRAGRPVMPLVDTVATLPLDAAAMQRGYSG